MTRAEFRIAVQDVLVHLANPSEPFEVTYPLIWSFEDGPRPNGPYLTINLIGSNRPGLPFTAGKVTSLDTDVDLGDQLVSWDEDGVFSIQGYGTATEDVLDTMVRALETEAGKALTFASFLAIRNVTAIRETSQFFDEQTERRFLTEITVGIDVSLIDQPGYIEHIELEETYVQPA